ncbi:MAG TPA: DedA family protein, partial [Actinomycetota bacterium]|nr:DedA family protein [Actinomycetota bacterium]
IVGGFYARIGNLELLWVAAAACLGAIVGDNVGYLIGHRFGRGFLERHGHRMFITDERLERADRYYGSHGGKTVFLARFIPVVRSVGSILAGVAHMPWRRFLAYDAAGAILWGVGHSILGYAIGASYERWKGYLTPAGLAILLVLLLLIAGSKLLAARRKVEGQVLSGQEGSVGVKHDTSEE